MPRLTKFEQKAILLGVFIIVLWIFLSLIGCHSAKDMVLLRENARNTEVLENNYPPGDPEPRKD